MIPIGTIFDLDQATRNPTQATLLSSHHPQEPSSLELVEANLEAATLEDETKLNEERAAGSGTTCLTCGIGAEAAPFASADQQRAHFKTDWHRYNVKRRIAGLPHITETDFLSLIENEQGDLDAVGSLSGSESDVSEDEDGAAGTSTGGAGSTPAGPQFIFHGASENERLGVWRCLVAPDRERGVDLPAPAESLAALEKVSTQGGKCAVILFRGGHFAAAIYTITPPKASKANASGGRQSKGGGAKGGGATAIADAALQEVSSKSFHKYVVRAKAGGKQSTKDATGKYAKSAGSRLRRHNEMALVRDVTQLMTEWKSVLAECSLILMAAPGSNGQTLFSSDAGVLDKKDPRVRKVPFVTRRPTLSETRRVMRVLLTLYSLPEQASSSGGAGGGGGGSSAAGMNTSSGEAGGDNEGIDAVAKKALALEAAERAKRNAEATSQRQLEEAAAAREEQEAARKHKAEKKARQKEREREKKKLEAAEKAEAAAETARLAAANEISKAAAQASAFAYRPKTKTTTSATGGSKASVPARLSARPSASEDPATRRLRMAAAAEARAKALQDATSSQKLW